MKADRNGHNLPGQGAVVRTKHGGEHVPGPFHKAALRARPVDLQPAQILTIRWRAFSFAVVQKKRTETATFCQGRTRLFAQSFGTPETLKNKCERGYPHGYHHRDYRLGAA